MTLEPNQYWWSSSVRESPLDSNELTQLTRDYWRKDGSFEDRLTWYIEQLLPEELRHADGRGALEFHPCHKLALLVGHSIEPLLQAISVLQPQKVVLVLSQSYDRRNMAHEQQGIDWGREVESLIVGRLGPLLPTRPEISLCEVADSPDAVFHGLCGELLTDRQARKHPIVDITGGKKSMVAGAFLFAAYADIPITYVNFDDYDELMRRPLGFSCRIGTLTNPYDAFRLREWERVQRLYENYHFRAASETVRNLLGLQQHSQPDQLEAVQIMLDALQFYEAWDDGDYSRAKQMLPRLQSRLFAFSPPAAVAVLGDRWPHARDTTQPEAMAKKLLQRHDELRRPPHSLFESNDLLITYARDELAKIDRLVQSNEDNRSALLRAAGLDELLLKARWVRLWQSGDEGWVDIWRDDEQYLGRCRSLKEIRLQDRLYLALMEHHGTEHMRRSLQMKKKTGWVIPSFLRLDTRSGSFRARPTSDAPRLGEYEKNSGLAGETLTQLRNQAIHMYLYVTQPVAEAAVALAAENLKEFEDRWATLTGEMPRIESDDVRCLPWDEVCRLCGVDFLPVVSGNVR